MEIWNGKRGFGGIHSEVSAAGAGQVKVGISNPLDNLLIQTPPGLAMTAVGWEKPWKFRIKRYLTKLPFLPKLTQVLNGLTALASAEKKAAEFERLLKLDDPAANAPGSPYGYADDIHELHVALAYQKEIADGLKAQSESKVLYQHSEDVLTELIRGDKNIHDAVNFGVSHAHIDSILAGQFTGVQFHGIDRSSLVAFHNHACMGQIKNLHFTVGDVFDLLSSRRWAGGVFFHMRTTVLLTKAFLDRLYAKVREAGFKYIVGFEPIGISRQLNSAYRFSYEDKPSAVYRGGLFIHNYPGILKRAGHEVQRIELVKTGHPHPDMRILSFTAAIK